MDPPPQTVPSVHDLCPGENMSQKARRNDPCPCGSGQKYKKCCLSRQQQEDRRVRAVENAQQRRNEVLEHVMVWLKRHHEDALSAAFEEFGSAAAEDGRDLSGPDRDHLLLQATEWVLAEGMAEIEGRRVRLRDLAIEKGPILDADQRLWFQRSTEHPLRLWRVVRTEAGVGLELEDLLDESAEPIWAGERSASRSLARSDVVAARLGRWQDAWELTILYSIPNREVLHLLARLEQENPGDPSDPGVARAAGKLIRDYWVELFTRRRPRPKALVDPGGDALELTTDHWQILDEDELVKRLEAEPDVVGSRENGWSRLEDPDAGMSRTLLALNPGKKDDRLEVFARTRKMANEGRAWLELTVGPCLRFLTREIVDPMSERFLDAEPGRDGTSLSAETFAVQVPVGESGGDSSLPPEVMKQFMEDFYRRQYEGLADEAVPMLGNKSPREVLKEPGGPRRVRLWLEGFERNEERMAEDSGREAVDLGFLWQKIGLDRESR